MQDLIQNCKNVLVFLRDEVVLNRGDALGRINAALNDLKQIEDRTNAVVNVAPAMPIDAPETVLPEAIKAKDVKKVKGHK